MIYTQKMQKAIQLAIQTHEIDDKQKRKGKDIPYITHPLNVGLILATTGASEDLIVAGILHDTIEDSIEEQKVTVEFIGKEFGDEVAQLVLSVTEQDKSLSWEERKKEAIEHIKKFLHDSLLLKSADIIANSSELIADYKKDGDKTFERFNAPKERILNGSIEAVKAILEKWSDSPLAEDLKSKLEELNLIIESKDKLFITFVMNDNDGLFEVHLVNPTDITYKRVFLLSGAFCSDDGGLIETSKFIREKGELLPHSSIIIDQSDSGELDFVIWYQLDLYSKDDTKPTMVWFDLPRGGRNYDDKAELLPVIQKRGMRIELNDRMDGVTIEESIKTLDMAGKYTKSPSSD